jgi:hypothetical protein
MSLVRPAPGVASHPEDHGDRRDRRGTAIPHAVDRAVRSAFGGPHVAMRKAGHQNGRESACARGDTGAGIQLPGDATSFVTGPRRAARELEIKVADGGAPIDGVVALLGLPEALQSLNAERAK